jgi:hypothetical protein
MATKKNFWRIRYRVSFTLLPDPSLLDIFYFIIFTGLSGFRDKFFLHEFAASRVTLGPTTKKYSPGSLNTYLKEIIIVC